MAKIANAVNHLVGLFIGATTIAFEGISSCEILINIISPDFFQLQIPT